jgi:hypothetical protein
MGMALGVVQDLLVAPPAGSLHPRGQPVHAHYFAACGHLPRALPHVGEGGDEGTVGLAVPQRCQPGQQQIQTVADLGLGDPDHAASTAVRQPVEDDGGNSVQAHLQRQRRVPPCRRGRGGSSGRGSWPARPAPWREATSVGSMPTGPDLLAGVSTLPMVWSRQCQGVWSITDTLNYFAHSEERFG